MSILYREADLNHYPDVIASHYTHVSLGDLHGNALKLIYILIEEGIFSAEPTVYLNLGAIYNKPLIALRRADLAQFKALLNKINVNPSPAVTLIGDELADRGQNDYFTLLVLEKLGKTGCHIEIILSNHGIEFIRDYENGAFTGRCYMGQGQGQSLYNMYYLIANGLVSEGELRQLVVDYYKPLVKAIGYTRSEKSISLFTHAPVGLETIAALAQQFAISYHDASPDALCATIDAINERIHDLFEKKQLTPYFMPTSLFDLAYPVPVSSPFYRLIWNRAVGSELEVQPKGAFKVQFVHGHIGEGPLLKEGKPLQSHQNLDNLFGKFTFVSKTGFSKEFGCQVQHFTRRTLETP